ncbi:CopL family metal-binding regulatory protein [Pseudoxanthomonas dokdonensis]|uniref:CopL family metal-binding regulatory protein n=1 Tax=Pseudoxanthomonas dokdonensis TaxID=344882 RepID=A0A0R0CXN5_9GAMM|nr:CopL family metal-binding regulatory protein [Pseudoxanthomonas dokdonensis]KRG71162.1 hypothetical protein ABB29_04995 [Pseudoxanthomonas dokdonensis]
MRASRPWLSLLLVLMLVFNGIAVAGASVSPHASAGAAVATATAIDHAGMDRAMADCHEQASAKKPLPAATAGGDCCQPQDCDCACAQHVPLSHSGIAWQLASPGHAGPVHPLHNGLAPPARLAIIRPPIG